MTAALNTNIPSQANAVEARHPPPPITSSDYRLNDDQHVSSPQSPYHLQYLCRTHYDFYYDVRTDNVDSLPCSPLGRHQAPQLSQKLLELFLDADHSLFHVVLVTEAISFYIPQAPIGFR